MLLIQISDTIDDVFFILTDFYLKFANNNCDHNYNYFYYYYLVYKSFAILTNYFIKPLYLKYK